MTNLSSFYEFQKRNHCIMNSFNELRGMLPITSGGHNVYSIFGAIFLGWMLASLWILLFSADPKRKACKALFFAAFHEKIKRKLPSQRLDTYNTLVVGVNRVLRQNTEEPTVFLLLATRESLSTAHQLAVVLVHCTLVSCGYPATLDCVKLLLSDGAGYGSHDDEWPFFYSLRRQLRYYGVAAVFGFEQLHPQVVRTMQNLVPLVFAPYPESVLILVANIRNRFTEHQKRILAPNQLGRIFLQELLGPYFDQNELLETFNQIGSRCILVNAETRQEDFVNIT